MYDDNTTHKIVEGAIDPLIPLHSTFPLIYATGLLDQSTPAGNRFFGSPDIRPQKTAYAGWPQQFYIYKMSTR